jgi:hypothetical protein
MNPPRPKELILRPDKVGGFQMGWRVEQDSNRKPEFWWGYAPDAARVHEAIARLQAAGYSFEISPETRNILS